MKRRNFVLVGFSALASLLSGCLSVFDPSPEFGIELDDVELEPGEETEIAFTAYDITRIGINPRHLPPSGIRVSFAVFDPAVAYTLETNPPIYSWDDPVDVTGILEISADEEVTPGSYEVGIRLCDRHDEDKVQFELFDIHVKEASAQGD